MGRLFWKFFFLFWIAQIITSISVGSAIWALRHSNDFDDEAPPPPPQYEFRPPFAPHFAPNEPWAERRERYAPPPPLRRDLPLKRRLIPPLMPIIAGGFVSLIFAALLAWYFARPIRTLRDAFDSVADGKLDTRVGAAMRKRDDEFFDLGQDFDRMAERLQGLIERQQRLLHDVSHELRSPLARLQAAADLMRQQPDRALEFIERLERDTGRMDRLVGELLTLARLDDGLGRYPTEEIDLAELLAEIVDDTRIEAETRGCRIVTELPTGMRVNGNADLLRRAVENVLRNALRYTPEGGSVEVNLRVSGSKITISIADRGPGVRPSDLDAIFEPFFRAVGADSFAGYGLGLAIVRRVMQVHGGSVRAENRPDGGLVVTLELPRTV